MVTLDIHEYDAYDELVREWPIDASEEELRLHWQLLEQLDADEVLVVLPEWLADEKVGFIDGGTPTEFVGRIARETEKAILLDDATAARPLMQLAHRIHHLNAGVENVDDDEDRREWLERQLDAKRQAFNDRADMPRLKDAWLPKSQLVHVGRKSL